MRITLAAAVLVLLAISAHAQTTYAETCNVDSFTHPTDLDADAMPWISVAFMFVAMAIAVTYMYGKLREDPAAQVWAKDEAANLIITVFMFVGLLVFFTASCGLAFAYVNRSPFESADYYLDTLLQANGRNVLRSLTYSSLNNQFDATFYRYYGIAPFWGSGIAEYANKKAYSAHKEFLIDMYMPLISSLTAQKYLLQTIEWISASILLPFAFVMRIIPPMREFGNMLIALFFTLYIVVPTVYALSGKAFESIAALPTAGCVDCTVHNFYSLGIDGGNTALAWREATLYKIGITIPQAVFIPNLVLVVAITCITSLSKAFKAMAA